MSKVFIIGYMFAGKTTYGQQLASELCLPFIDLDSQIEDFCRKSIPEIFHDQGENYFRKTEHDILENICKDDAPAVVACGGGTPCFHGNLGIMKRHGKVVYLRTPFEIIVSRAVQERQNRPLLSSVSDNELTDFIGRQLKEREYWYLQADVICDSQSITPL